MFLNIRSIRNKTAHLSDYILSNDLDIVIFCETWLKDDSDNVHVNDLLPDGYSINRVDRDNGKSGGGLAVIYKTHMQLMFHKPRRFVQFECIMFTLSIGKESINVCGIYRPPPSKDNGLSTSAFIQEWSEFAAEQTVLISEIIIIGDFNIHLDVHVLCSTSQIQHII